MSKGAGRNPRAASRATDSAIGALLVIGAAVLTFGGVTSIEWGHVPEGCVTIAAAAVVLWCGAMFLMGRLGSARKEGQGPTVMEKGAPHGSVTGVVKPGEGRAARGSVALYTLGMDVPVKDGAAFVPWSGATAVLEGPYRLVVDRPYSAPVTPVAVTFPTEAEAQAAYREVSDLIRPGVAEDDGD